MWQECTVNSLPKDDWRQVIVFLLREDYDELTTLGGFPAIRARVGTFHNGMFHSGDDSYYHDSVYSWMTIPEVPEF